MSSSHTFAYASIMKDTIPDCVDIPGYADDHAVKVSFSAVDTNDKIPAIRYLEHYAIDIKSWMDQSRLKMNSSQTEFIIHQFETTTTELYNSMLEYQW